MTRVSQTPARRTIMYKELFEEFQKLAAEDIYLAEKVANKLSNYIRAATDKTDLQYRVGNTLRNSRNAAYSIGYDIHEAARKDVQNGLASDNVIRRVRAGLRPIEPRTTTMSKSDMLDNADDRILNKKRYDRQMRKLQESMANRKGSGAMISAKEGLLDGDPEEYMQVIHGGDHAKIKNFINSGNTHYRTENTMLTNNPNKPISEDGFMFHSSYQGRAVPYANMYTAGSLGEPAVLTGKVKRKYLYHNQGDEYSLPKHLYDKIENPQIFTQKSHPDKWYSDSFYDN